MDYKVCVYAIAKDEEKHVDRFMDTAAEADYICILDTGSTDKTIEMIESWSVLHPGVIWRSGEINPWRFDVARNESIKLIPDDTDICVCIDLDEVLSPGWRKLLEAAWTEDADEGRYTCVCCRNADGSPATVFLRNKIHRPGAYIWKYPVHEVLTRVWSKEKTKVIDIPAMCVDHLPDNEKSREDYLKLLELAVEENPEDARCAHYLGREYMYNGMWDEAIYELWRHLDLPSATW